MTAICQTKGNKNRLFVPVGPFRWTAHFQHGKDGNPVARKHERNVPAISADRRLNN